jgi:hypothetical protein
MKVLMASKHSFVERGRRRAPRGPKSKVWGQNRRDILKFLIDVLFRESDNEEVDGQRTSLSNVAPGAPKPEIEDLGPKPKRDPQVFEPRFFKESDNEGVDGQWTLLHRTGHRPGGPKV